MDEARLAEIRKRVQSDFDSRVAWAEWNQAEKDRAILLEWLEALKSAGALKAAQGCVDRLESNS